MAWSHRHGKRYYYQSVRRNGRPTKIYFGAGWLADCAYRQDVARRQEQAELIESQRQLQQAIERIVEPLEQIAETTSFLVTAQLLTQGFYRQARGPWRKRYVPRAAR